MAVPVIASTPSTASGTPSAAVAVPSGVASGSLLVAYAYSLHQAASSASNIVTPPAGWTQASRVEQQIATSPQVAQGVHTWFYKRATGADTGTYTFTESGGTAWGMGVVVARVTGAVDTGSPFEAFSTSPVGTSSAVVPALTPSGDDRLALAGVWLNSTTTGPSPSGWALGAGLQWADGNRQAVHTIEADAVALGPVTFTGSSSLSVAQIATLVPAVVAVVRTGTGTLTLSGAASVSGGTLARTGTGTLALAASGTVAGGTVVRTGTGTLALTGSATTIVPGDPWAKWRAAVAQLGTRQARILWVGDSLFEGYGATARSQRIIEKTTAKIRARYGAPGSGAGYLPPYYTPTFTIADPATTTGATTTLYGQGARAVILDPGEYVQWAGLSTDAVDVVYRRSSGSGTLTVSIDGVNQGTTINASGTTAPGMMQRYTMTAGTHTVRVTASGSTTVVEGLTVYSGDTASGVVSWDSSHTAYSSNDYGSEQTGAWGRIAPDLVIYDLINNNFLEGGPNPTTAANDFANYVAALPSNTTVVVMTGPNANGLSGTVGGFTYQNYVDAIKAKAPLVGAVVMETAALHPTNFDSAGWIYTDGLHPNATGYDNLATWLDQFLAEGATPIVRTGTGTLSLTSSATALTRYTRTATATLTLSGSATATGPVARTAAGALALSGTASAHVVVTDTGGGHLVIDGSPVDALYIDGLPVLRAYMDGQLVLGTAP